MNRRLELLPVYCRRVGGRVRIYRDALCLELRATMQHPKGPRRNSSAIVLNCFRWRIVWVPA